MATATVTPAGSAVPTSGAGGSSSSASPSTSTPSTGSTPSTPAATPAASQPTSTPSAPEFKTGDNSRDYLKSVLSDVYKNTPELQAEGKPEEKPAAPATAQPEVKPAAEAAKPEGQQPEAGKEGQQPEAPAVSPLDKIGPLPAEKLQQALTANPNLEAELTKAGIDKDTLFQTSRDAAETSQYREVFPTVESAKFASESANHFYDIEDRFPTINSIQDFDKFVMETMLPLSMVLDDKGQPIKDGNGNFKTDGSVEKFLRFGVDLDHQMILHIAKQVGGEQGQQLQDAIAFIDQFRQNGYKFGEAAASGAEQIPPHIQAELDQARADRERTQKQSRENDEQAGKQFNDKVFDTTLDRLERVVGDTINATSLDDYGKTNASREIWETLRDRLKTNRGFQQQLSGVRARGRGEDIAKELVALNVSTAMSILPKIMNEVLEKAGARQISAQGDKTAKINGQIADDRMNRVGGASATQSHQKPMSEAEIFDKAMADETAEAKAKGEMPGDDVIRRRALTRFAKTLAAQQGAA